MSAPKNLKSNERYNISQSISPEPKTVNMTTMKRSARGKSPPAKKPIVKPTITPVQLFIKDLLSDFLKQAVEIGEFHSTHKQNQLQYENRYVQKELNFFTPTDEFKGKLPLPQAPDFLFLSTSLNKYITITPNGLMTMTSFTTNQQDTISLSNFYEKDTEIISCELYESSTKSMLLLLYTNFNFCSVDLFEIDFNEPLISLYNAKSPYFNLKAYLNIPTIKEYKPYNNLKVLSLPKSIEVLNETIIMNFTQIANRIIIFNFNSFTVVNNLFVSPDTYSQIDSSYIGLMSSFIKLFFKKKWTINQSETLIKLIDTAVSNKTIQFDLYQQLSYLLSLPNEDYENLAHFNYTFIVFENSDAIKKKSQEIYTKVIVPLLAIAMNAENKCGKFNIFNLLMKIKLVFLKLKSTSKSLKQNNLSLIDSPFGIYEKLFIQCFQRGIDLRMVFIANDKEKKGYLSHDVFLSIMHNLPIGLTEKDIEELIAMNYIFDECNNFMYEYLFMLEEERITRLIYSLNQKTIGPRFQCGFYTIIGEYDEELVERSKVVKRRASFDVEYNDEAFTKDYADLTVNAVKVTMTEESKELKARQLIEEEKENNDVYNSLAQYLLNASFSSEISTMVFLQHLNLFFVLSANSQNMSILQVDFDPIKVNQTLNKIGVINLLSYAPPKFIEYIPEKNVLITERIHSNLLNSDLIMLQVYKDILVNTKENEINHLSIDLSMRRNVIQNIIPNQTPIEGQSPDSLIQYFKFLPKNELFLIGTSTEVILINCKSKLFEISYKIKSSIDPNSSTKSMFADTCKNICEYPSEKTGDLPYKIEKRFPLPRLSLFKVLQFALPSQSNRTDWLIFVNTNNTIMSYCSNQLIISIKAKEIDNPIPEKDLDRLFRICVNHMKKAMNTYLTQSNTFNKNNNEQFKAEHGTLIKSIAQKVKETEIHNQILSIDQSSSHHIKTIHDMIKMIKEINVQYDPCKLTEMHPLIQFLNQFDEDSIEDQGEYFKTELFPMQTTENNQAMLTLRDLNMDNEETNLPKNSLRNNNDIAAIGNHQTVLNSAIKKFAKFSIDHKIPLLTAFFKRIDVNDEEIINLKEFLGAIRKMGMCKDDFITEAELKEVFEKMDVNKANCVTAEEFNKFFEKYDIETVLTKVQHENDDRINDPIYLYDNDIANIENMREKTIKEAIDAIEAYYQSNEKMAEEDNGLNEDMINQLMMKVSMCLKREDIQAAFPHGVIFLPMLQKLVNDYKIELNLLQIETIFKWIDRNNKNMFLYTKDFIKYLPSSFLQYKSHCPVIEYKLTLKDHIHVIMSIMKKLIKYSLSNLNIPLYEFTDRFLLNKKVNKTIVVLEYLPTKLLMEKTERKVKLSRFENFILFKCYCDVYDFGILFKKELKSRFDAVMKIINDRNYFNFDTFDSSDSNTNNNAANATGNIYINETKVRLANQTRFFTQEAIAKKITVYDRTLMLFLAFTQKMNLKGMGKLASFIKSFDKNNDSFLSPEEFNEIIKKIFGPALYTMELSKCMINNLVEFIEFINEKPKPFISINRLILFLIYNLKHIEYLKPRISNQMIMNHSFNNLIDHFRKCLFSLSMFNDQGIEIESFSSDYLKLTREGIFSGMIILNKLFASNDTIALLQNKKHKINDYKKLYMTLSNDILINNFNARITGEALPRPKYYEPDYTEIEIPIIRVNILDNREMINRRILQCGLIENFDYYHPELNTVVNITKCRKSFLLTEISSDASNLLSHIEYSLKVNHYLQKEYLDNDQKESFPFIRNFGMFIKEIIIDKVAEEEIYIVNERIQNSTDYISMYDLVKSNGGLLQIPELANTDMAFYILRFWGKSILEILARFEEMNVCCKYFTLKDFYVSNDGKMIKMRNLLYYASVDMNGKLMGGPDIYKIFLLLDQLGTSDIDALSNEKIIDVYNDAYLAPEFLLDRPKGYSHKIDSWSFGVSLFHLLYGFCPNSFYHQLKHWCDTSTNLIFERILHNLPYDILSKHFFFNPYENIKEILEDEYYFTKVLKLKSFSAIIKEKYLNLSTENTQSINGLGIILDMINACLAIDATKRPDLVQLYHCDLFAFDQYELILCNKFLDNVLNYYSPEIIIEKNMLEPLRGICSEVLKNELANPLEVNNYENFLFEVIRKINTYLFSKEFIDVESNADGNFEGESTGNANEGGNMFVKNPEYYFKNSMIIKSIIENKIIDLLIFLVLRHFNNNLMMFRLSFMKNFKEEMNVNAKNLNESQKLKMSSLKNSDYKMELKRTCGRLLIALTDLLSNCIAAMSSYDHMLTLYVENIIVYVTKLFIGEEVQLTGDIVDQKNDGDELNKYVLLRTFLRDDKIVSRKGFEEDEADLVFSVSNSNRDLHEVQSRWSPELYQFTIDLFKDAFGDNGAGNFKHVVIKNYFTTMNDYDKNIGNQMENPFVNNKINRYITIVNSKQIRLNYSFINSEYINELLALADCSLNNASSGGMFDNDPHKNLANKKHALSYIYTVFRNKNANKIRACLDFKIHFFILSFLYTNRSDSVIVTEVINILKEISMSLIDINEIGWMFGNNYAKIFNNTYKKKSDMNDLEELSEECNWDCNFSLIDFMNRIMSKPHSFILYFTDKFLGLNLNKRSFSVNLIMNEIGSMFSSPLCLKPLMQILQKPNESIVSRQRSLDILFNLMLSNNQKIMSTLNLTLCNFYEIIIGLIHNSLQLPAHLKADMDDQAGDMISKAKDHFKATLKQVVTIIIELQNPFIKTQMFSSASMMKYMEQNNLQYVPRLDIDVIESEFKALRTVLNFTTFEDRIVFLINAFKCWLFHLERERLCEHMEKVNVIVDSIGHIFNNEWAEGLKLGNKNCLVFNIVKLYEWMVKKDFIELMFPKDDITITMSMMISLLTKVRENNVTMKEIIEKINSMNVSKTGANKLNTSNNSMALSKSATSINNIKSRKTDVIPLNPLGNRYYTLQKIYNFISIKMLNIISLLFGLNDPFYNSVLQQIKFGLIFAELLKIQYATLGAFLNQENIDMTILDNYMHENRLRIDLFQSMVNLSKEYDEIKLQFLQSEFIGFIFKEMVFDFRKFKTDYKKLSLQFLPYKESYPLRTEAISMINLMIKKNHNMNMRTQIDSFIYDELVRNVKISHLIQNELAMIKNRIKGPEVNSVLSLFNVFLCNKDMEMTKMMTQENARDYFLYSIQKDTNLKRLYPVLVEFMNQSKFSIDI